MVATGEVSKNGDISELTNRMRFFVGNIGLWSSFVRNSLQNYTKKFGN
jgi:hypothetical protein